MKTLGGSQPDTCYARYGSMPINKSKYLQELALRILLCDVAKRAAVYGRSIKPILSVGMNFYVRVFIEVNSHGPSVKNLSCNIGTVYQSVRCPSYHVVPNGQCSVKNAHVIQPTRAPGMEKCGETGGPFKTAGPIWLGPLHDSSVVNEAIGRLENLMDGKKKMMKKIKQKEESSSAETPASSSATKESGANGEDHSPNGGTDNNVEFKNIKMDKELHGLLTMVSEELNDVPLYYVLPDLCHTLGCSTPPMKMFKAALLNAGYRVSGYHKEPQAVKTDAPNHVVWDILRVWCKDNPPKKNSKKKLNKQKKRKKSNRGSTNDEEGDTIMGGESKDVEGSDGPNKVVPMDVGETILSVEASTTVDFKVPEELKGKKKVCRFPQNPEAHWGPKKAASGYKRKAEEVENEKIS